MLSEYAKNLKARHEEQEEKLWGAVYLECEKRGCSRSFAKAFGTRAELFPVNQTLAFLEYKAANESNLKQWEIFLQVLIDQKPEHEKCEEWKRSVEALHKEE